MIFRLVVCLGLTFDGRLMSYGDNPSVSFITSKSVIAVPFFNPPTELAAYPELSPVASIPAGWSAYSSLRISQSTFVPPFTCTQSQIQILGKSYWKTIPVVGSILKSRANNKGNHSLSSTRVETCLSRLNDAKNGLSFSRIDQSPSKSLLRSYSGNLSSFLTYASTNSLFGLSVTREGTN